MEIDELDSIIKRSLDKFCSEVLPSDWFGREHEWVSRYLLGYLANECSPGGLRLTQIGFDVAVRQIRDQYPGKQSKPRGTVQKDLVVWPESDMTLWDMDGNIVNEPMVVMEWKIINRKAKGKKKKLLDEHMYDKFWLEKTALRIGDKFAGYAILIDAVDRPHTLRCWKLILTNRGTEWAEFLKSSKLIAALR